MALLATLAVPCSSAAEPSVLEPYRRLARSPEGVRLLTLARETMERAGGLNADSTLVHQPVVPDSVARTAWPGPPLPVYVSLVRGRETRACVGVDGAARGTLGETVAAVALETLRADRRRPAVRPEELAGLRVVISITDEGEPVAHPMLVDPGCEGLSIRSPRGSVTFLPGEARTVGWALSEARRLGVLRSDRGDATFRRLDVVTLAEDSRRLAGPATDPEE
jgi:AMMECR1 domain-containing protein